jgi:hypothetical protein
MRRLFLNRSEPAKKSGQNIPKNRCRTTIAERIMETLAELPFIGDQVVCLNHEPSPQRNAIPRASAGGDPHTKTCRVQMADNASPKNPVPPNTVTVCTVMAQLPTAGELSRERAYQTCGWRHAAPKGLLRGGRNRIEFAAALLNPPRADVALYCHADMVRAIARTCRV